MRFIFALLIACLSLPAMAAHPCAPVTPAAHATHGAVHPAPAPDAVRQAHECIGCIAPIDGMERVAVRQTVARAVLRTPMTVVGAPRLRDCPATPPPKPLA